MCLIENTKGNVAKKKKRGGRGKNKTIYIFYIYFFISLGFFAYWKESHLLARGGGGGEVQETEEAPTYPPMHPRSYLRSALYQFGEVARALCLPDVRPHWATASREDRQDEEVAENLVG